MPAKTKKSLNSDLAAPLGSSEQEAAKAATAGKAPGKKAAKKAAKKKPKAPSKKELADADLERRLREPLHPCMSLEALPARVWPPEA